MMRSFSIAITAFALASCGDGRAKCWKPPAPSVERDQAMLQMLASPDRNIRAAGYAQRAERCIDRTSNSYGRGRDAADIVAAAVAEECRGDLEMQASTEAISTEDVWQDVDALMSKAKRRATILIVRDRAAKCI